MGESRKLEIGQRIKTFRKRLGLEQTQLAERLNVTRNTVGSWETGINYPKTETLFKLAEMAGFSVGYLLTGIAEEGDAVDRIEAQLLKKWRGLSPDKKLLIYSLADAALSEGEGNDDNQQPEAVSTHSRAPEGDGHPPRALRDTDT